MTVMEIKPKILRSNGVANIYRAFVSGLQAQSGKGGSAQAATIMIADAQYLITHCP